MRTYKRRRDKSSMMVHVIVIGQCLGRCQGSPSSARQLGIASIVFSVIGVIFFVIAVIIVFVGFGGVATYEIYKATVSWYIDMKRLSTAGMHLRTGLLSPDTRVPKISQLLLVLLGCVKWIRCDYCFRLSVCLSRGSSRLHCATVAEQIKMLFGVNTPGTHGTLC